MHQPFMRIFPNQGREAWCRRRRLKKDNPYGLPAGDYVFYDLYPVLPEDPSVIFLLVQHVRTGTHLATLELSFSPQQVQLDLNLEYLQSPAASRAFELVRDTLKQEPGLQEELWERLQEVGWVHQELNQPSVPQTTLLSEITVRTLAGTMESLMQESHPRQWEGLLDSLLASLRQELLAALHQHLAEQNKVVSLDVVRQQKAARQGPESPS